MFISFQIYIKDRACWRGDEPDNIYAGGIYWNWLTRGGFGESYFEGKIFTQDPSLVRYPPVPLYVGTILAVAGERLGMIKTSQDIIVAFHWAGALFFALLVVFTYRWALFFGLSEFVAVTVSFLVLLYPTMFGHGFSSLKDIAQASLFTVSLYYLVRGRLLVGAIIWGLALATKFNAIYVPIIWILWQLTTIRQNNKTTIRRVFFVIVLGLLVFFAVWPYLWFDPINRILEVIRYFTSVGQGYNVLFNGVMYPVGSGSSLWWYPWQMLVLVTPLPLTLLFLVGFWKAPWVIRIWFFVPLLRAILPQAAFYDGIRHFMEVIPSGALLVGFGLKSFRFARPVTAILMTQLVFINFLYFPHSAGYLNMIARNPNQSYDRDIEGLAVKEGMDYLHSKYGDIVVWVPFVGHLSWYDIQEGDRYVYRGAEADSIILINKGSHFNRMNVNESQAFKNGDFAIDRTITRGNAVIGWVWRRVRK